LAQRIVTALQGALSEQECIDFLVVNCGFAALRERNGCVDIRFCPLVLTDAAFHALAYDLHGMSWYRAVAFMHIGRQWHHEILPSDCRDAIERIKQLVMEHQLKSDRKVLRKSRPFHTIPKGTAMDWVFQLWRRGSHTALADGLGHALAEDDDGRYAWIDTCGDELIMSEVGGGFPAKVRAALTPGVGRRVQDQPDEAFGRYCSEVYGSVARTRLPSLEDVDAIMTLPCGEPVRRLYSRLILPFSTPGGNTRLLGISFENRTIDLRRGLS
jgi:hypothetical protein